ncbi:hypothetical protein NQZ68_000770 [Dissostichus eleginoides]|nr:hypothetical protein NQZ68_000770 [Dissostichus eleginoides]
MDLESLPSHFSVVGSFFVIQGMHSHLRPVSTIITESPDQRTLVLRGSNSPIDAIISTRDANEHPRKKEDEEEEEEEKRSDHSFTIGS